METGHRPSGHLEGWAGSTGPGAPWIGVISSSSVLPPPIHSHFLCLSTLGLGPHQVSASENSFRLPIWLLPWVFWDMGLSTFTCHLYNHTSLHLLILENPTPLSYFMAIYEISFFFLTHKIFQQNLTSWRFKMATQSIISN